MTMYDSNEKINSSLYHLNIFQALGEYLASIRLAKIIRVHITMSLSNQHWAIQSQMKKLPYRWELGINKIEFMPRQYMQPAVWVECFFPCWILSIFMIYFKIPFGLSEFRQFNAPTQLNDQTFQTISFFIFCNFVKERSSPFKYFIFSVPNYQKEKKGVTISFHIFFMFSHF